MRGSTTTPNTPAGDAPDEGDSSGRSRAHWALILAGLIISGSTGMALAQTVPVLSPVEDVTESVDDVIVEVKDDVSDKTKPVTGKVTKKAKSVAKKARRAVRKSERVTHEAVADIKQTVAGDELTSETRVATQTQAQTKKKNKKPSRERKRRETTAQENDSRGEKNEDGDVNTLVDAGNEIEGTRVKSAQVAPDPERRQESLPLTGFDPRALALIGFGLISAGLLLLVARDRPLPIAGA